MGERFFNPIPEKLIKSNQEYFMQYSPTDILRLSTLIDLSPKFVEYLKIILRRAAS